MSSWNSSAKTPGIGIRGRERGTVMRISSITLKIELICARIGRRDWIDKSNSLKNRPKF